MLRVILLAKCSSIFSVANIAMERQSRESGRYGKKLLSFQCRVEESYSTGKKGRVRHVV